MTVEQAMHDLLVWFVCHGWTDCDAELADHALCQYCECDPCVCPDRHEP